MAHRTRTVAIDIELHRRLKVLAAQKGVTIRSLVEEAIRGLLKKYE